eukprot:gnl/Dysnectes_brevis/5168_a7316_800.p1 GENE.gnl/Dysnectes_brevis/5168_a7316_800~~gnl/Dysnectes_brevis/5168_a7316_800.p1  ORF type:complete len:249 (-),score=1.72 gnl/Dysnectes_brevis/5168_a7316_800:28-774(-)
MSLKLPEIKKPRFLIYIILAIALKRVCSQSQWKIVLPILIGLLSLLIINERIIKRKSRSKSSLNQSAFDDFISKLLQSKQTSYDHKNQQHQQAISAMATSFGISQIDINWKDAGFQRHGSPITDFRAMGMLVPELTTRIPNLSDLNSQSNHPEHGCSYPLALLIISIGNDAVKLVQENPRTLLSGLNSAEAMMDRFAIYVSILVQDFHKQWIKACPENMLGFPSVYKPWAKRITSKSLIKLFARSQIH